VKDAFAQLILPLAAAPEFYRPDEAPISTNTSRADPLQKVTIDANRDYGMF
jgi:hypothetical protein